MKSIPKASRIRINKNTKAWTELNTAVRERDKNECVSCESYVGEEIPLHHEPPKSQGGEDVYEKMCVMCVHCHYQRHHGKDGLKVKVKAMNYLRKFRG